MPPEIRSVCSLTEYSAQFFDTKQALAQLKDVGALGKIPVAAARARAALFPVDHNKLTDRLTALGMMMAPNRPPAEARVWLNEMTRLLGDLPEDILATAIDGLVKTSKFLPTCSEIREVAEPLADERRRLVSQVEAMARYLESGQPVPTLPRWQPPAVEPELVPCTPEQAAVILDEFPGLKPETRESLASKVQRLGPPRKPTRADYIAMGVDPGALDGMG